MANEPENLVLELLRAMRTDLGGLKADVKAIRAEMPNLATKDELTSEMRTLRADVASDLLVMQQKNDAEHKATREQIVGLRRALMEYHSTVIGHGILISELDTRMRRVEQHLELPPLDSH
jgi:hypothetical protein